MILAIHVYRAVPDSLSVEAAVKQPPGTSAAAEVRPVRDGVMEQLFLDCPVERKSMFLLPYLFCLLTPRSVLIGTQVPGFSTISENILQYRAEFSPSGFPYRIYRF